MKTVIEMARIAGVRDDGHRFEFSEYEHFLRFVELVRAETVTKEREACAYRAGIAVLGADRGLANRVDQAIRAKGQKPDFWEGYVPEPDKRQQALDKKAENARELGLDYEPAQQAPVALEAVYETIIHWDEGGGKRSRRELARRIVSLYHASPHCKPLTDEAIATVYWGATGQSLRPQDNVLAHNFARAIEAAHGIKENT